MAPKEEGCRRSSVSRKSKANKLNLPKRKPLTEDYPPRFPQCLREAKEVRNEYLIAVVENPANFVLGPIYYPHAPVELPTYYPVNFDEPLLLSLPDLHRTGWVSKGTIRSWPSVFETWEIWVKRMKKFLAPSWREMNVYEAIDLSTQWFELNPNLIAAAACFWSVSSNVFVFPCGPMTPNVLDIIHLTGLSCVGEEVNAGLHHKPYDPPFEMSSSSYSYANFIDMYSGSGDQEPCFDEKIAFYLYWINKYVMCVSGVKITKEYIRLAVCLAQNMKLALAPFVLGTLYKGLWTFVQNKITNNCGGPFWILQAWLYAYFPAIKPLGNYSRRDDGGECLSYAEYFLSREPTLENISFKRYFKTFYNPDIGDTPNWLPFKDCSYATSEGIKSIFQCKVSDRVVNEFWAAILIPRFISIGFSPSATTFSNCSFEVYCPNQCARQLGLVQGIPIPYTHPRIKDLVKTRPNVTEISVIKELVTHFQASIRTFQFQSFVASSATTPEYNFWWKCTTGILFTMDLENCLFRLDSQNTTSDSIPKKLLVPEVQGKAKGKKVVCAGDSGNVKKRTRSFKAVDDIHNSPIMVDATKRCKVAIQQEETTWKEEVEGSEIIGTYKTKTRRKLRMQPTSDEDNGLNNGSTRRLYSVVDSKPSNITSNIQLSLEYQIPKKQENQECEKVEISEESKSTEIAVISVQNSAPQLFTTIANVGDTSLSHATIFPEVVEEFTERNADISMTDMLTSEQIVVQEEVLHKNKEIQSNAELECQHTFTCWKDKEEVQLGVLEEKDAVHMENKGYLSPVPRMMHQILQNPQETDGQLTTDSYRNIGCEPFLLTEIIEAEEQPQGTEFFPTAGHEFTIENTAIASCFSVSEVNPELVMSPSSELDLMFNKVKLYSEAFSKSVSEFSESLTPPHFYVLEKDTKNELECFFKMLELPLVDIATDHTTAFTNSVSQLIAKKVLPLSEHIRFEEFQSTLSENLTEAAICQKQMREKRETIDQFANVSKNLDTMGNNIQHLKDKLCQMDVEEAKLVARLSKLKEERRSLLAEKESMNDELINTRYNKQEIEVIVSAAKGDFLRNQEKYNLMDNKWSYFKRLFMEFKSKIR